MRSGATESNSGAGLFSRTQESTEITDNESTFGIDYLAFESIRLTIGMVFERQMFKTQKRRGFLKIENLMVSKIF
jgi:hypothetical protein